MIKYYINKPPIDVTGRPRREARNAAEENPRICVLKKSRSNIHDVSEVMVVQRLFRCTMIGGVDNNIISGQKPGQGGSGAEESVFDGWKSDKWPFSAETEGQWQK